MYIDTHAHLYDEKLLPQLPEILTSSRAAGVDAVIIPATDIATSETIVALCSEHPMLFGAVGVHPHDSKDWHPDMLNAIRTLAAHNKIVAIGEIGLDYFYDFSPKEKQKEAFIAQLQLAVELDLPVIIHNRESDDDMLEIVSSFCGKGLKAQFHCFGSTPELAMKLVGMGHFISFTGNITFAKMEMIREVARVVPLEHIMIETDSPYMAPVPHRGKTNTPVLVPLVAHKLAEVRGISPEDAARITSFNAFRFFGINAENKITLTYKLGDSLYINVTNRCNADCVFCDRKGDAVLSGYNLKMAKKEERPAADYIAEIGDPKQYKEIVFCGYGEPTIRWELVKEIAGYVKQNGGATRINTNGHANIINKRNITPELQGLIDVVSISLNAPDKKQYAELMRVDESMYSAMLDFAVSAKQYTKDVILSVVTLDEVDRNKCKSIAENLGLSFRERNYF